MDGVYTFGGTLFNQAGGQATAQTVSILQDLTDPLITANISPSPVLTGGSLATFSGAVSDNHELGSTNFTFDYAGTGTGDWLPYGPDAPIGDGDAWDGAYTTSANPSVTVNFVAGVQLTDGADLPVGLMNIMTNVRTIAIDIAGNPSVAVSNNINPGTINLGTAPVDYAGAGILAPGWLITEPAAAVSICNGEDPGAEEDCVDDLMFERTVDIEVEVTGLSGSFPNPFLNGRIYFYMVDPITAENILLADLSGNAASLTDVGVRTYQWTYTLTLADVTDIVDLTVLTVFAIGVNADGEGLRLTDNVNITVRDGL